MTIPARPVSLCAVPPTCLVTLNTLFVQGAHIGSRVVASLFAMKLGVAPVFWASAALLATSGSLTRRPA